MLTTPLQPVQLQLPLSWWVSTAAACSQVSFSFKFPLRVFRVQFYMQNERYGPKHGARASEGLVAAVAVCMHGSRSTDGYSAAAVCAGVLQYDV